ncbi:MAG TPA: ATP-binding cassette domain-containing protein [Actinomycetota bacterium]
MPESSNAVIRTEGLSKTYPTGVVAVDSLDMEVRKGEIFGLLGPNGAGKTTTVGMLTTRVIPTGGHAWVSGVDVVAHPVETKRLIGVVSQTNTLDRSLSVWENLYHHGKYFGMSSKDAKSRSDEILERFRLADRATADVSTLSGGMAQRLMVARSIVHHPSILFLDEPTSGLDPQSRLALWEILGEIHGEGQTILLTTHYMEEADRLCSRVAIMDHGHLLALDQPAELKRTVGADTILKLRTDGDTDALLLRLKEVEGVDNGSVVDGEVMIAARATDGLLPRLIQIAESGGFDVRDVSVAEPTLETVFINLTGKELRE